MNTFCKKRNRKKSFSHFYRNQMQLFEKLQPFYFAKCLTFVAYLKNAHIFLYFRKVGFEVERSIGSTLLQKRRCSGSTTRFLPKTTFVQMEKRLSERLDAANLAGAAIITSLHLKAENFCHCSRLQLSFKFFDTLWSILPITSHYLIIQRCASLLSLTFVDVYKESSSTTFQHHKFNKNKLFVCRFSRDIFSKNE